MESDKKIKILYNPRCGTCRTTLANIREAGEEPEIVEYLKETPTVQELKEILAKLDMKAEDVIRKKEKLYIETYKDNSYTEDQWLHILVENPILIQRPIVIKGEEALVCRPAETVKELL